MDIALAMSVLSPELGIIGLASDFVKLSEAVEDVQELLNLQFKAHENRKRFLETVARLSYFRSQFDSLANELKDAGSGEFGSFKLQDQVRTLLPPVVQTLKDMRDDLLAGIPELPRRSHGSMIGSILLERKMESHTKKLETIGSSMALLVSLAKLSRTRPSLPPPQEDSQTPGSSFLTTEYGATDFYPKGVNNIQKRFLAKLLFEARPQHQFCINVRGDHNDNAIIPSVAALDNQLLDTLSTNSRAPMAATLASSHALVLILCETEKGKYNTLPFDRAKFIKIVDAMHLPLGCFQALLLGTPKFVHYAAGGDIQHAGLVFRTPSSNAQNWTLALSWSPKFESIRGIIHGLLDHDMKSLESYIGDAQRECAHPLNISAILCEMLMESDLNGVRLQASVLHQVEKLTNYSDFIFGVDKTMRQDKQPQRDFSQMTRDLNVITSRLAFHEMRVHASIVFVDNMADCLETQIRHPDNNITHKLKQRLAHLKIEQRSLLLEIACNQKIAD
jgi:hypothetical protein